MYSIRAGTRGAFSRRVLAKKKSVRELCQTHLSIPRVVIVIVVTAIGATVQKTHPPRYKRSVRESRDLFCPAFRHVTGRAPSIRTDEKLADRRVTISMFSPGVARLVPRRGPRVPRIFRANALVYVNGI